MFECRVWAKAVYKVCSACSSVVFVQVPEVVEYNQVLQQARQDPTLMKSPQRTASIRASSMPRLAADPQVINSNNLYSNLYSVTDLILVGALKINKLLKSTQGAFIMLVFAPWQQWIETICPHILNDYYRHRREFVCSLVSFLVT